MFTIAQDHIIMHIHDNIYRSFTQYAKKNSREQGALQTSISQLLSTLLLPRFSRAAT